MPHTARMHYIMLWKQNSNRSMYALGKVLISWKSMFQLFSFQFRIGRKTKTVQRCVMKQITPIFPYSDDWYADIQVLQFHFHLTLSFSLSLLFLHDGRTHSRHNCAIDNEPMKQPTQWCWCISLRVQNLQKDFFLFSLKKCARVIKYNNDKSAFCHCSLSS